MHMLRHILLFSMMIHCDHNERMALYNHNTAMLTQNNYLPAVKREKSSLNPRQNNLFGEKEPPTSELSKERGIAVSNFVPGDLKELDEKVKSMMEKCQNRASDGRKAYVCKVCGKEGQWVAIRDHIEANHFEEVSLPCNVCGKEYRSRNNLRRHTCRQN